jgi:hypothetical protein
MRMLVIAGLPPSCPKVNVVAPPLRHLLAGPLQRLLFAVELGHVAELLRQLRGRGFGGEVRGVVARGGRERGRQKHRNERADVPTKSHSLDLRGS